jgi:DNA-directed RNA polymerase specialized sigma24 family protein
MSSLARWRDVALPRRLRGRRRFHTIVGQNVALVGRLLRRLGIPDFRIEEVSHEVFLELYRQLEVIAQGDEQPFLIQNCLRRTRRADDHRDRQDGGLDPARLHPSSRLWRAHRLLNECLTCMPRECREVFVLHDLERLELGMVAELLAIPEATAWQRLHGAHQHLAMRVKRDVVEPDLRHGAEDRAWWSARLTSAEST